MALLLRFRAGLRWNQNLDLGWDLWPPALPGHIQDAGCRSALEASEISKAVNHAEDMKNQPERGGEPSPNISHGPAYWLRRSLSDRLVFYKENNVSKQIVRFPRDGNFGFSSGIFQDKEKSTVFEETFYLTSNKQTTTITQRETENPLPPSFQSIICFRQNS